MYNQITSNKRRTTVLILFFIAFVLVLGYFFDILAGAGGAGLGLAVIISLVMTLTSYFAGDKIALASAGAKQISHDDNQYVYHMVENLCITAGIKTIPKVYIIEDPAPNAFACGRDPEHASIALSTGIINMLENEELEGVIAHELSHIKNYDIRIMTIVILLVGVVTIMSDLFFRLGGLGKSSDSKNSLALPLFIAGIILMILSPLIAKLIQLAVSRKREYLADADGALLTRYPAGLANALEKISTYNQPMIRTSGAIEHLYIVSPLFGKKKFGARWFSTHPPIEDRIAKLRAMA